MAQPLLEGSFDQRAWDNEIAGLRGEISRLTIQNRQLDEALRLERIKAQTLDAGVKDLRDLLWPLYRSLRLVFGEMDEMGIRDSVPPGTAPQFDKKWEAWKEKLGSTTAAARIIQAILDHGPLNRSQLRQATKSGWSTLDEASARLKNLQLIEKVGDRWNLKS